MMRAAHSYCVVLALGVAGGAVCMSEDDAAPAAAAGTGGAILGRLVQVDVPQRTVSLVPASAGKDAPPLVLKVTGDTVISDGSVRKSLADLTPGREVRVTEAQGVALTIATPSLYEGTRITLPDFSEGLGGLVGPFFWGRAADLGADVRFCDEYGRAHPKGDFLWLYQWRRGARQKPPLPSLHERNNLVSRDPRIAYEFQPWHVTLNTPQTIQVLKLMVGYVAKDHKFQHGDNTDLIHLANTPRVAAFVPIRRAIETPSGDQSDYVIDMKHDQAPFGVFELAANETMASGPMYAQVAKERVLLDLRDRFKGEAAIQPGVTKPIFRFTIEGAGKWTLKIKLDGRDGVAGGPDNKGWDLVFTPASPGARPYTVGLTPENSAWAMSVFNPGGVAESSDILVHLKPFDRATGQDVPWPNRMPRIASCPVDRLTKIGASDDVPTYDPNGRLQGGRR